MRNTFATLFAVALLCAIAAPFGAQAQNRYENRYDRDRDAVETATPGQLAAADRRLNLVYQRRIADARADDRSDRRFRGWYSQEQALRESERLWIDFRDAECRYLTQQQSWRRGGMAYMRGCLLNQTNQRTAALRDAEVMLSSR
jgi:uncharacterized protein YecT (DUF1311 family)